MYCMHEIGRAIKAACTEVVDRRIQEQRSRELTATLSAPNLTATAGVALKLPLPAVFPAAEDVCASFALQAIPS